MASFRQRGDAWRVEISVNGTRESATFDTKTQARAWASKRETELREQALGKLPDYTLKQAVERYISEVSPKKKSHLREANRLTAFLRMYPALCKKPIAKITTDDLVKWRDDRLKQIDKVFKEGVEFKKCGVILTCIESKSRYVPDLLADHDAIERNDNLQTALEQVNEKFSKKLAIGPCLLKDRKWSMSRGKLTQNYFSFEGLLEVG